MFVGMGKLQTATGHYCRTQE